MNTIMDEWSTLILIVTFNLILNPKLYWILVLQIRLLYIDNADDTRSLEPLGVDSVSLNKVKITKVSKFTGIDQSNYQYSSKFIHFCNFHQDTESISALRLVLDFTNSDILRLYTFYIQTSDYYSNANYKALHIYSSAILVPLDWLGVQK